MNPVLPYRSLLVTDPWARCGLARGPQGWAGCEHSRPRRVGDSATCWLGPGVGSTLPLSQCDRLSLSVRPRHPIEGDKPSSQPLDLVTGDMQGLLSTGPCVNDDKDHFYRYFPWAAVRHGRVENRTLRSPVVPQSRGS